MPAVSIHNLNFTYRNEAKKALDGINFEQEIGQLVVIMGKSGVGKSTLCRCLNNLIPKFQRGKFSGEIFIFGEPTAPRSVNQLAQDVGMVFQDFEAQLFSTNVELEVAFGSENFGVPQNELRCRVKEALDLVGLSGFERRQPVALSGGEKQRLAIASILAMKPKLLVMDEPTTDLDPQGKEELFSVFRRLKEQGITLLVVEHETEEALNSDKIAIMDEGKIVETGSSKDILAHVESLEKYGIRPPQVAKLLFKLGYEKLLFRAEETHEILQRDGWNIDNRKFQTLLAQDELRRTKYGEVILNPKDLSYTYKTGQVALDGITLTIREGEFVAIIGQNGSGKTTLVKHLNGLLKPTGGDILCFGKNTKEWKISEIGKLVGYVFQNPDHQIFADTVQEEVSFAPKNYGFLKDEIEANVKDALKAVNLEGYEDMSPFLLTKGERQRVAVASVLACKPKLIILDEPTTGLDYHQQYQMMELLRKLNEQGHTIIIVTHSLWGVAEYAHRVIVTHEGRLLLDCPVREAFVDEKMLQQSALKIPEIAKLGRLLDVNLLSVEELEYCLKKN